MPRKESAAKAGEEEREGAGHGCGERKIMNKTLDSDHRIFEGEGVSKGVDF
jgi:hypothetical protein